MPEASTLRLKVSAGNAAGTTIEVDDELEIGRAAEGAGALAADVEISRRHARIARSGSSYAVEDLGSRNGTFLNGRRIDKAELLGVGDEIQLGGTTMIVQVGALPAPAPAEAEPEAAPQDAEAAAPLTEVTVPPRLALRFELDFEAAEARVALDDGSDYVRLVLEDGAWRIKPGE
jgi:predicted component of type VI protein secretion system